MTSLTKAKSWFEARLRGERLPEHELSADQLTGDLLCPLCGEPIDLRLDRTEYGSEWVGVCAACNTTVDVAL